MYKRQNYLWVSQVKQTNQCNVTYPLHVHVVVTPSNYKRRKKGKGQDPLTKSLEWDANYQNN